jgi:hypothetical protein
MDLILVIMGENVGGITKNNYSTHLLSVYNFDFNGQIELANRHLPVCQYLFVVLVSSEN